MAEITAALVKELREKTGAGMMDCKKALGETQGDLEGAVDWLRKKGLAAAAKKAGRVAAEGLIGVAVEGTRGALVEVNAETDFVARNEQFQGFVRQVARQALDAGDIEALAAAPYGSEGKSVAEAMTQLIATIGENMTLAPHGQAQGRIWRGRRLCPQQPGAGPGQDRRAGRAGIDRATPASSLPSASSSPCMSPRPIRSPSTSAPSIRPRSSASATCWPSRPAPRARPEEIIAKMVEGRLRKYYEEVVLLEQVYVIDGESRVKAAVAAAAKEVGAPIAVAGFHRMVLGEGIQREQKDFAAEVAAQLGS